MPVGCQRQAVLLSPGLRLYHVGMTPQDKADLVSRLALEAGFDAVGFAEAGPVARQAYFREWLRQGRHGEMDYLARTAEIRVDPGRLLPGARSLVVVAQSYKPAAETRESVGTVAAERRGGPTDGPRGRIARYAWGRDYHRVLRRKLRRLADRLRRAITEPFEARVCVDTAPVLEREFAAAAGVGWIGKNTLLMHPRLGSYLFLGEIVTTLELAPSRPMGDRCGSCSQCLEACPTGALVEPHRMDATRCIAYLTIEHRGEIPAELASAMGEWVFGCDLCQEVCPYNRKAPPAGEPEFGLSDRFVLPPRPLLEQIMNLTDQQRRKWLSGSAMKRATLAMLKRNAAIAMENEGKSQNVIISGSSAESVG